MCVKILACDVGLKRIGVALFAEGMIIPLSPILRKNRNQASKALRDLLNLHSVEKLIVGIPQEQEMQKRIQHFIALVQFEGEIFYINEDLSSIEAQERLAWLSPKERREKIKDGSLDCIAAMIILERYLGKSLLLD